MAFENTLKRHGRLQGQNGPLPTIEHKNIIGVNYADSIYTMPANQSPYAWNVDFGNPIGTWGKAPGFEALFSTLGTGQITGVHGWPHSVGDQFLFGWDKNLYLLSGTSGSISKTSQADWQAGTSTDLDLTSSAGDIKTDAGTLNDVTTNTADFDGTHSNTATGTNNVGLDDKTVTESLDTKYESGTDYVIVSNTKWVGQTFTMNGTGTPAPIKISKVSLNFQNTSANAVTVTIYDTPSKGTTIGSATATPSVAGWIDFTFATPISVLTATQYYLEATAAASSARLLYYQSSGAYAGGQGYNLASGSDIQFRIYTKNIVSGTYTHTAIDISGEADAKGIKIVFNKTVPATTTATVSYRISADGGDSWGDWDTCDTNDVIVAQGTDKTDTLLQWKADFTTFTNGTTATLDDVTVSSTYANIGTWLGLVHDITNTPTSATIAYTRTTPASTACQVYVRGSSNGTVFGDWQEALLSGDLIPLQRYLQVKLVFTATNTATPTFSDYTINYSNGYTVANKLDIAPLGRISDLLTGNRVRFCNYQDWLLMADGLRPFMAYIDTGTQVTGTAAAGGASTITLAAGSSTVDHFYTNAFITITGGTGSGQTRWISGYTGSSKLVTVSVAWTSQPDNTSVYSIGSAMKVRNVGIDPPDVAPSGAAHADAGSPNGAYLLKYTFVDVDGIESNPSPASATCTVSSKKITWTVPVDDAPYNRTATRRLYRTAASGAVYKYIGEIADNTTGTYLDNTADSGLGSLMLDNNNIPPVNCSLIAEFTSYVFYTDGYEVWFSKAGNPDQVPNTSGDIQQMVFPGRVQDIKAHPTALLVSGEDFLSTITSNTGFVFDSDPTIDTTTTRIVDGHGCLSYEGSAMCLSPNLRSTLVLPTLTGIRATIPGLQDNSIESVPLSKNVQYYYERCFNRDQSAGVFYNNYYYLSLEYMADDAAESQRITLVYDLRTEQWYGPWEYGMGCYAIIGNVLYAGDAENGIVYRMNTGNSYGGANIHMVLDLPMIAPAGEQGNCKFETVCAVIDSASTTTSTVIKPKVDEREATITPGTLATTYTGDTRPGHNFIRDRKRRIPLPNGHTLSYRIEDDSTNPLKIEKLITEYKVLNLNK